MKARGRAIIWPPNPAPHITEWLIEIGPSVAGSMGEAPISWGDITAWQQNTGIELDPWEARTIRRLSQVFVSQRYDAEKPDCPAPYRGPIDQVVATRADVASRVKAMFGIKPKKVA